MLPSTKCISKKQLSLAVLVLVHLHVATAANTISKNNFNIELPLHGNLPKKRTFINSILNIRGGAIDSRGGSTAVAPRRKVITPTPRTFHARADDSSQQHSQRKPAKEAVVAEENGKKASIATSVFNLANNVAGAGILTLAAGKASGTGWIPSVVTCVTLAFLSAHTFTLIGKACELTGEKSFKGLWSVAFGSNTAYIVDSMVFIQCFCVSIIYTGLLGDIFSALVKSTKNANPNNHLLSTLLPDVITSRTSIILLAATCILWPLNQIQDLSALAFTSILGLCAVLYTVFFIVLRSLDGSYSLPNGKFIVDNVIQKPSFEKSTLWNFDFNTLILMSNLGLAFIAHYNGPSYWEALSQPTSERFTKVSLLAYTILAIIYTVTMCAGYGTFGDICKGNILLNYHPNDILSTLGRLATGVSIIFGFPLISNGARVGLKNACSALDICSESISNPKNHRLLVTTLLLLTTSLAIKFDDIQVIAGLTGALMGSSLVYICPTLIYSKIVRIKKGADSIEYRNARRNLLFVPFGIFIASMGVAMTIKKALN